MSIRPFNSNQFYQEFNAPQDNNGTQDSYVDEYKLIKGENPPLEQSQYGWFLNLAILRDAIKQTYRREIKGRIEFLINNYLDKSTPVFLYTMKELIGCEKFNEDFQVTPYKTGYYHRTGFLSPRRIDEDTYFNKNLALKNESPLILTETDEIEQFYPLFFDVANETENSHTKNNSVNNKSNQKRSTSNNKSKDKVVIVIDEPRDLGGSVGLINDPKKPVLFDFTSVLGPYININDNKDNERIFNEKFQEIKDSLENSINDVADRIVSKNPHLIKDQIKSKIKSNFTGIVRVKLDTEDGNQIGGIKVLPLFSKKLEKSALSKTHEALVNFVMHSGIALGAVTTRRFSENNYELRKDISYGVSGPNVTCFEKTQDFLNLSLYKRLLEKFNSTALREKQPHMAVLGKATIQIFDILMKQISLDKWNELNQDPAIKMVVQTTLYKMKELLATAELQMIRNDYTQFAECMELFHCELATLLEMVPPFKEKDFVRIYKDKLIAHEVLPSELAHMTKARLNRNAMNGFAGLNAAVLKNTPNPTTCFGKGVYYEEAGIVGDHHTIEEVLNNKSIKKVDFYACQTNPNIEVDLNHTHYKKDDIIGNIKTILKINESTQTRLTVSIDCTIDHFKSEDMKQILRTFENEVKAGTLNFIIFNSGQKFDMLGQEIYYGSPCYMINNGESQWDQFNHLFESKIYQPDPLSLQWFCLAYHNPTNIDEYKNLIFDNTKEIMKQVPNGLKYDVNNKNDVFISEFDTNIKPTFIDIKISGPDYYNRSKKLTARFYEICAKHGVKAYKRASFGFPHPSITWIPRGSESVSIRINPGINQEDNRAILAYLNEIEETTQCKKLGLDESHRVPLPQGVVPKHVLEDGDFRGELYYPLPEAVIEKIKWNSWREGAPVALEDLAYLTVKHYDLNGNVSKGEVIFHKNLAPELLEIFHELFQAKYPIDKMLLVDHYHADDGMSMIDNNGYAFCSRKELVNSNISIHSYGCAIDINPRINPYVKNGAVYPKGGEDYVDRSKTIPGLIQENDACHQIFSRHGYQWGGNAPGWTSKDYHHFEKIGKDFLKKYPTLNLDASHQMKLEDTAVPSQVLEVNEFRGELYDPLPVSVIQKIKGKSWIDGRSVPLDQLAYLKVKHYDLNGKISTGEIIYNKKLAPELLEIFKELFEAKYPIDKMLLVDNYDANDKLSMTDNNTYGFCFRSMDRYPQTISFHGSGGAIDINPRINPVIDNNGVQPEDGLNFVDRSKAIPGMIQEGDACHQIFTKHGYIWGGNWKDKDYHHFQKKDKDYLSKG